MFYFQLALPSPAQGSERLSIGVITEASSGKFRQTTHCYFVCYSFQQKRKKEMFGLSGGFFNHRQSLKQATAGNESKLGFLFPVSSRIIFWLLTIVWSNKLAITEADLAMWSTLRICLLSLSTYTLSGKAMRTSCPIFNIRKLMCQETYKTFFLLQLFWCSQEEMNYQKNSYK